MRWHASIFLFILGLAAALASGCAADPPPDETTADGLVRVPARSVAGVYRAPDATFTQYRRVILEPPSISFVETGRKIIPKSVQRKLPASVRNQFDCFAMNSRANS